MFEIKNLSANALTLSDGTMLAQFETKTVETLGENEKNYKSLGWFQVTKLEAENESKEEEKAEEAKSKTKGEKKNGNSN